MSSSLSAVPSARIEDTPLPFLRPDRIALVVDDEEMIRTIAGMVLQQAGYAVLKAADGGAAVSLYRTWHARIGVVFLDLSLAGQSGADVLAELRAIDPGVNVLIASGNEPDPVLLGPRTAYLAKPFDMSGLLRAVRGLN
jgi:DNA-binding response OmpR family regulator